MCELTRDERTITANLLSQISLPIKDAPLVIEIIKKLQLPPKVEELKK